MGSVVGFDSVWSVRQLVCRDPFVFFVRESFPGYKVFNFSLTFSGGENLVYLLFFHSVNDVRRWRRRNLLRGKLGCVIRVEETFVEDWMDSTSFGIQFEMIG